MVEHIKLSDADKRYLRAILDGNGSTFEAMLVIVERTPYEECP